MFRKLWI